MDTANPAIFVQRDSDRFDQPVQFLNGRFDTKLSTQDSRGKIFIIDTVRSGHGGPPLHYHHELDEWFLVQEGSFRFQIGDALYELGSGDSILGPKGVPHAFLNLTPTARLLVAFFPAGSMEAFFAHSLLDPRSEDFRTLSREHGMEVVGPPLSL
ncbi:MAG: Cupin 2 conserved barrel domain protein [Devosia sp.]|nr:Cupin 2 conserved barrel domain protein [Devosia sp.]